MSILHSQEGDAAIGIQVLLATVAVSADGFSRVPGAGGSALSRVSVRLGAGRGWHRANVRTRAARNRS